MGYVSKWTGEQLDRSIHHAVKIAKTADYNVSTGDSGKIIELASSASTNKTFTLPSVATDQNGYIWGFLNRSGYVLTILASDADTIHKGGSSITLDQYEMTTLRYDHDNTNFDMVGVGGEVSISRINLDDGTDIGSALADADLVLVDDGAGGTNRKSAISRIWTYVTTKIQALSAKATPVSADILTIQDTEDSNNLKELTISNLEAILDHNNLTNITSSDHHTKYALTDDLVSGEITQLQNIDSVTISNTQWGYLGAMSGQPLESVTAHKDSHDPNNGSDPLDCAAAGEIVGVTAATGGSAHSFARSDHTHQIQHGTTDNHIVTIDDIDAADNDYAKFTANGLEGRSYAEVRSDLNIEDGADVTDTANVTSAGALMESELASITDVKALDQDVTSGSSPTLDGTNFTGIPGGGISWSVISSNTNASAGNGYLIDASSGNVTLTLPGSPSEGDTIGACDYTDSASTNTITIARNGNNIEGDASDLNIDVDGAGFTLVYSDASRGWEIVSEIGGGSSGGDLIKIQQNTPSGVAESIFTSGLSYSKIIIYLENVIPATDLVDLYLYVSDDEGLTWESSGYHYAFTITNSNGGDTDYSGHNVAQWKVAEKVGSASGEHGVSGFIALQDFNNASYKILGEQSLSLFDYDGNVRCETGGLGFGTASALNGLKFAFSGGNIESGKITVYGVDDS